MSQETFARLGFTLVELIIVMGIFAAIMATTLPFMGSFQQTETMDTQMQDIVQTLRRAQSRAISGKRAQSWGVQFSATGYVLFAGDSYASRSVAFDEHHTLDLAYSASGSGEVVFLKQDGGVLSDSRITYAHGPSGTGTLTINRAGQVLYMYDRITDL